MKELQERLRERCVYRGLGHDIFGERTAAMLLESADAIDSLTAKLAEAEETVARLREALAEICIQSDDQCASAIARAALSPMESDSKEVPENPIAVPKATDPCPHPARHGRHEWYIDPIGGGGNCRACGAEYALSPPAKTGGGTGAAKEPEP